VPPTLPALGRLTGRGNTANVEVVMRAKPDVIVDIGSTPATNVTLAERLLRRSGRADWERAGQCASAHLFRAWPERTDDCTAGVDAGRGADARRRLQRDRRASGISRQPDQRVGRRRAPCEARRHRRQRSAFAAAVRGLPGWRDVPAVANGRVYVPPDVPFGWFDAPPSLNRLLGVQWLARILHPDLFPEPLAPRVKAFHALYYHREATDPQVRALLEAAGPLK